MDRKTIDETIVSIILAGVWAIRFLRYAIRRH